MLAFHRDLLADSTRTLAWREAIRAIVRPDDVVLDLGCGTGILAFFACDAGARRVFAVDQGHAADAAAFLTRHLGYEDRVTVFHEHSTKVSLPEPATVLVTETLGALGFDERILSSVLDARRRLLAPSARIIPSAITLTVVPVMLPEPYNNYISFWSDPRYGYDLSPLRVFASNTYLTAPIPPAAHLASPTRVIDADLATIETPSLSGHANSTIARDGAMHGFALWFTATLAPGEISNDVPGATHWPQGFLPLEREVPVRAGDSVEIELHTNDGGAWRWRGRIGEQAFDQTTWLSMPPCTRPTPTPTPHQS